MSPIWAFDKIENNYSLYRGEDCMKKLCISVRQYAANVVNFEMKNMLLVTEKRQIYIKIQRHVTFAEKKLTQKLPNDKNYRKVRYHFHFTGKYRGTTHSICNLRFNVPKETPLVFLNGSYCSYYFIIKELEVEFKENLNSFQQKKKPENLIKMVMRLL